MTAMSIRKVNDVLQQVKCKPPEKMVLVVMADVADENGYCFPGIEYIRETACISRRTAINILQQMEERGDVYTHRTLGKHNRYIIMVNTSKEDFVAAAIEKLDMDEAQAVEAFLHVQNLAQGRANNAPAEGGVNNAPVKIIHSCHPSLGARVFSVWGALKTSCGSFVISKRNDSNEHQDINQGLGGI
jgi:hypothetical protein